MLSLEDKKDPSHLMAFLRDHIDNNPSLQKEMVRFSRHPICLTYPYDVCVTLFKEETDERVKLLFAPILARHEEKRLEASYPLFEVEVKVKEKTFSVMDTLECRRFDFPYSWIEGASLKKIIDFYNGLEGTCSVCLYGLDGFKCFHPRSDFMEQTIDTLRSFPYEIYARHILVEEPALTDIVYPMAFRRMCLDEREKMHPWFTIHLKRARYARWKGKKLILS